MGRLADRWMRLDPAWGIIVTGYQKFTAGVGRVTAIMANDGIPLPAVAGVGITALELLGGLLLLVGLGGRVLGLLYVAEFLVVSFYVQLPKEGFIAARLPIMLLAGALMLVVAGSGKLALDRVLWRPKPGPTAHSGTASAAPRQAGSAHTA